jgi:hypothetical protein
VYLYYYLQVLQYDSAVDSDASLTAALLKKRRKGAADCYVHIRTSNQDVTATQTIDAAVKAQGVTAVRAVRAVVEAAVKKQTQPVSASASTTAASDAVSATTSSSTTATPGAVDNAQQQQQQEQQELYLPTRERPLKTFVNVEQCSTYQHHPLDRQKLQETTRLPARDGAPVVFAGQCRPTRPTLDWPAVDALLEPTAGAYVAVQRAGAEATGVRSAQRTAALAESTAAQQSDATSAYNAAVRQGKRFVQAAQAHGDEALNNATQNAPLLRAFGAAAAAVGVSSQSLHVVVTRTSPDTQGADLPGELNEHNSSIVTQQSLLSTVVLGCMGADAHIVQLATCSESGRSNTGFTAEAIAAMTQPADCAWVTTYHRQGRGNKAMHALRERLSTARRRLLGAYAPAEMFDGLDSTEADAKRLLLRMWGSTAAVQAGIAAYPAYWHIWLHTSSSGLLVPTV